MPNRILKESICTSETLERIQPLEEVLFYRLLVNCDDYGRMDARPSIIRARCFPLRLDSVTDSDILTWLKSLTKAGLIDIYTIAEKDYLQVITWEKHQRIRAKWSKYPSPNGNHPQPSDDKCQQPTASDDYSVRNPNPNPNPIYIVIFDFWNTKNIIAHQKITDRIESSIRFALKDHTEEQIKTSIENYSRILTNPDCYFKYKWSLQDFLRRGTDKFLDYEIALSNYKKSAFNGRNDKKPTPLNKENWEVR